MFTHTYIVTQLAGQSPIGPFVSNGHTCNHRSRAENYRATQVLDPSLSLSLSDVTPFFFSCPFCSKGPNSQVAQIPHCTGGKRKESKKRVREKRNLIQLKATIIWMSHSAVRFGLFFFYVNSREGESDQRRRRREGGKSSHFGKLHLLRTPWGRGRGGRRNGKNKKKVKKAVGGMEGQERTDIGLDEDQRNFFPSSQIHPPGHGWPSQPLLTEPNNRGYTALPDPRVTVSRRWHTGK